MRGWTARSSWRTDHGGKVGKRSGGDGKDSVGAWRDDVPARALPARHVHGVRGHQRHVRDGDHVGPVRRLPRLRDGGDRARGPGDLRRRPRDVPLHARLSGRARALLHDPGPGHAAAPSWSSGIEIKAAAAEAVEHGRRDDHASPRGRARPSALVRPSAPRPVRRCAAGREGGARPGRDPQPGRARGSTHTGSKTRRHERPGRAWRAKRAGSACGRTRSTSRARTRGEEVQTIGRGTMACPSCDVPIVPAAPIPIALARALPVLPGAPRRAQLPAPRQQRHAAERGARHCAARALTHVLHR